MKNFIVLMMALALFVACDSKKVDSQAAEAAAGDQNHPQAENPVRSTSWCRADDWDNFQVVLRINATDDQMNMEFLKITPDGAPVSYPFPSPSPWIYKTSPMDVIPGRYVATVFNDATAIHSLAGFDEQKRIAEKVFTKNPQLKAHEGEFSPAKAVSLQSRTVATGDVVERNMYPCSLYSETLTQPAPSSRPFMEAVMMISEQLDSFTSKNLDHVAHAMALTYPVDPIDGAAFQGSQWCAWREVDTDRLLLKTVFIGKDKFVENTYSENFMLSPDEESRSAALEENASRSEPYALSFEAGRMHGKNLVDRDKQRNPPEELFAFIRDAKGVPMMVRMDVHEPDTSRPEFSDIYFPCSDTRATEFSTAFRTYLPAILTLQAKHVAALITPGGLDHN